MFKHVLFPIFALVICLLFSECNKNKPITTRIETPYVSIEIDTVTLKTTDECIAGMIFKDQYYIQVIKQGYRLSVFDKFGNIQASFPFPEKIKRPWMLEYCVRNNTLLICDEDREITTYYIDMKSGNLVLTGNEFPKYEDNQYEILSTSHGEWGGMVYFIDKQTEKIYRAFSNEVINVVKFDHKYYVTNYLGHMLGHSSIYEISDPTKMQQYNGSFNDIINNTAEKNERERYCFEGIKKVMDTFDICVVGSFIHKNRLLQIWNEYHSRKVYITELVNGKIELRYSFDFEMDIQYLYYNKNKHYLNFETNDRKLFGAIEMDNDVIKIHFIKQEISK